MLWASLLSGSVFRTRLTGRIVETMKKYLVSLMALLALTGLVLLAAGIAGTWTAETQGKNGPQTQTLTLLSKGGELTGKLDAGRGGPVDISEGKIEGPNVMFKIVREGKN